MTQNQFLNVQDVSNIMSISLPKAYKVIRQLNDELRDCGYLVISGKVSKAYFETRVYLNDPSHKEVNHASL